MVTLSKATNFSKNVKLIKQLYELTEPSYVDNDAVLQREINHCSEIYLLYKDNILLAFFMVNFEKLGKIDTYYLGLSSCHNDYKGFGFAKYLYNSFFIDCKRKEIEINSKILCWWTTATPIPFKWFNENIFNCEPDLEGNTSRQGLELFKAIATSKYESIKIDKSIPFVLPNVAEKTNYSDKEKNKLTEINRRLKIKAFEKYPIDETKGDRYLMIGFAPDIEILNDRIATHNIGHCCTTKIITGGE